MLWWFGATIVRLENYRYASVVGFCREYEWPMEWMKREDCPNKVQTRTHPARHLFYALSGDR